MSRITLTSVPPCPDCGHPSTEAMPTDHCLWLHECTQFHHTLRPRPGDCCVFCSYGSVPCTPVRQAAGGPCV